MTYNFHAAVSTFLEGRASAKFALDKGWKVGAVLAPNYAYGQDAAKAFVHGLVEGEGQLGGVGVHEVEAARGGGAGEERGRAAAGGDQQDAGARPGLLHHPAVEQRVLAHLRESHRK